MTQCLYALAAATSSIHGVREPGFARMERMNTAMRQRRSRSDEIYDALRQMIVTARLPPGAALVERDLCTLFSASRTPLREAVLRLAGHGLVTVAPQHGTFVASLSPRMVRLAHFLRENLELPVISQLAAQGTPDLRAARATIIEQKLAEARDDSAAFILLDDRFHQALFDAAGLPEVWDVIRAKKAHLDRIAFGQEQRRGFATAIAQHEQILNAIEIGDTQAAVRCARDHVAAPLAYLEELQSETDAQSAAVGS